MKLTKQQLREMILEELDAFQSPIINESVNERKYSDQTGAKSALMREPQFSNLLSSTKRIRSKRINRHGCKSFK